MLSGRVFNPGDWTLTFPRLTDQPAPGSPAASSAPVALVPAPDYVPFSPQLWMPAGDPRGPNDFDAKMDRLQSDFRGRYRRGLTFVGATMAPWQWPGDPEDARDVRVDNISDSQRDWVKDRADRNGVELFDYSDNRGLVTGARGIRFTGPHFHLRPVAAQVDPVYSAYADSGVPGLPYSDSADPDDLKPASTPIETPRPARPRVRPVRADSTAAKLAADIAGFNRMIDSGGGREGALREAQRLKNKWGDRLEAGIGTAGWAYVKPSAGPTLEEVVRQRPPNPQQQRQALAAIANVHATEPTQAEWDRWAEEGASQRRGQFMRNALGWGSPSSPFDENGYLRTGAAADSARQESIREAAELSSRRAAAEAQRRADANAAFNAVNSSMPPNLSILGGIPLPRWATEAIADLSGGAETGTGSFIAGMAEDANSPLSPVSHIEPLRALIQRTVKPAGRTLMQGGAETSQLFGAPEGFMKDVFSGAGASVPVLLTGGDPLLAAAVTYNQAKGEGKSEGEAIKDALLTAGTFGLMKQATPFIDNLFPGAGLVPRAARFGVRAAANTAIPQIVEAPLRSIEGKSPINLHALPGQSFMGAVFAAAHSPESNGGVRSPAENRVGSESKVEKCPRVPLSVVPPTEVDPAPPPLDRAEFVAAAPLESMTPGEAQEPAFVSEARRRLHRALSGGTNFSNPLGPFIDTAIITGHDVYRTAKDFGGWSAEMVRRMGETVKPHLEGIWDRLQVELAWDKSRGESAEQTSQRSGGPPIYDPDFIGPKNIEFNVAPHAQQPKPRSPFASHHAIQAKYLEETEKETYDRNEAPTIMLDNTKRRGPQSNHRRAK